MYGLTAPYSAYEAEADNPFTVERFPALASLLQCKEADGAATLSDAATGATYTPVGANTVTLNVDGSISLAGQNVEMAADIAPPTFTTGNLLWFIIQEQTTNQGGGYGDFAAGANSYVGAAGNASGNTYYIGDGTTNVSLAAQPALPASGVGSLAVQYQLGVSMTPRTFTNAGAGVNFAAAATLNTLAPTAAKSVLLGSGGIAAAPTFMMGLIHTQNALSDNFIRSMMSWLQANCFNNVEKAMYPGLLGVS